MTSPLIHHLTNWHVAAVITRPLTVIGDCGRMLIMVSTPATAEMCSHQNLITVQYADPDHEPWQLQGFFLFLFFLPCFSLCLLIILILSIPSFFLGYRCCSVNNNNTVICLITLKKHLLLSWSPVQEQPWDQGTSNVVVRPWVIISDHAETQYSPQLHLIIVFVVLRGLKWPPLVSVSRKY